MIQLKMKTFFAALVFFGLPHFTFASEKWDMPTPYGDGVFHTANIRAFAEDVEKATDGALQITVHSAGSLIKHPEIKNSVRRGLVPIGELLMSRLGNEDAAFEVDSVPFLATDYDQARQLWEASIPVISAKLEAQGLKLLFAVPWPPQGIYAGKEIRAVEDLAGTKFRAYNTATERVAELAGALPTQVEAPDVPVAFASGRVEAMITSPVTGASTKAWDYVSHFHHTQAWLPKNMVIVNGKAFARLDDGVREAVLAAARAAEDRGWTASRAQTDETIAILQENGMTVVIPSDALMESFRAIGTTMTDEWAVRAGEDGGSILSAYRE